METARMALEQLQRSILPERAVEDVKMYEDSIKAADDVIADAKANLQAYVVPHATCSCSG
jgi:hypothetical protein